jgi:hypothetical protein
MNLCFSFKRNLNNESTRGFNYLDTYHCNRFFLYFKINFQVL